jgi:crotonobetainyl-CoA:carnitine CoA-transferase CaiB-like acyl-CoA transferase
MVLFYTFVAASGLFVVGVVHDRLFARLCEAVGLPGLAADERFASNEARVANVDALAAAFESVFRTEPADHWVETLRAAGVPVGPINRVDEAFELAAALGLEPIDESHGVPLIAPPLRLDGSRPPVRRPPPKLDQHGEEIRTWLRAAAG